MATIVRLKRVYEGGLRAGGGYSLRDSFTVYSFGWVFDGSRGAVELCRGSIAVLEQVEDRIVYRVYAVEGERCWEEELARLSWRLGLNEDYTVFWRMCNGDPILHCIPEKLTGYRLRSLSVWASFLVAVCQQNASFRQGWGMLYRLHANASRRLVAPEEGLVYLETPQPESLNPEVLRASGLGYRSKTVMEAVNARVWELDCSGLDRLREVRGVGEYTTALVKLLACRCYDVLPLDRWLRRIAAEAYEVEEREAEEELTRRFNGWRGLAALMTTVALDAEPLRRALERLRKGEVCPGKTTPSPVNMWKYWRVPA